MLRPQKLHPSISTISIRTTFSPYCCVQLTGMKLLPAEGRTTAQPSQSTHGQVHPGFIDITPCGSPWLFCCQILNTVHESQEQKPASASSPDLLAQGQRDCALLLHTLSEQSWLQGKEEQDALRAVLQRTQWDRNPGAAQAKPVLFTGLFQQQSCHPCFWLVDNEFPLLPQKLFFLKARRGMFIASNLIFY